MKFGVVTDKTVCLVVDSNRLDKERTVQPCKAFGPGGYHAVERSSPKLMHLMQEKKLHLASENGGGR
jgi:hypothetical protein